MKKNKRFHSPIKRKVLLLLQAGFALSLTPSPRIHFSILKQFRKEWNKINEAYLHRIIKEFYNERLVDWQESEDGTIRIILTELGKKRAFEFNIDKMKIKIPSKWDGKWRTVFFDIPEKRRKARDALRKKIRELGFYEMQKSVFVYPYHCRDEVDFVIEFFDIRPFVRYAELTNITNEAQLRIHFGLR